MHRPESLHVAKQSGSFCNAFLKNEESLINVNIVTALLEKLETFWFVNNDLNIFAMHRPENEVKFLKTKFGTSVL